MFHQIQGTAMGTKMAPAYANLFMAELEQEILDNYNTEPILWNRYIDDILCIWPGSQVSLKTFIQYLNRQHRTIKFTFECSPNEIQFLDVTIHKGERYKTTGSSHSSKKLTNSSTYTTCPPKTNIQQCIERRNNKTPKRMLK